LVRELAPLGLTAVEVLEHTMQEAPALHLHTAGRRDQAGVVVVPVEARALQVVIERSRAEVTGGHPFRPRQVRLERAPRFGGGYETQVRTQRGEPGPARLGEAHARPHPLGLLPSEDRNRIHACPPPRPLASVPPPRPP